MESSYQVSGLTCDHCVRHVLAEVEAIPTVTAASLALADGRLKLTSAAALDFALVARAVAEAGDYQVVAV
ncbi:MAG: cation transporter [Propionibacteriaceae bacterium]|nr:cation transporter [Propionibacteriaceae bacterium]